jgi:cobalt ECF transporter T component CbiQ
MTTTTRRPATPAWLLQPEVGLCPCGCIGRRRKGSFLAKTTASTAGVLQHAIFADDLASAPGLLQRLDPRTKVVSLVALLLASSLTHHVVVLAALYGVALGLAACSCIPLGHFTRRVWLFVPIFTGVVVLPATLNLVTPGEIVVSLGVWFGHPVGITAPGLAGAILLTMRVAVSISFVVLVTLTTSWTRLLAGMRALLVPRLFVAVLAMAYRYLFHLLDAVTDLYTARRARTVRSDSNASGRAFVAASAGALFGKSHQLADEVHDAMIARGYTGEVRTLEPGSLHAVDAAAVTAVLVVAASAVALSRALGG